MVMFQSPHVLEAPGGTLTDVGSLVVTSTSSVVVVTPSVLYSVVVVASNPFRVIVC